MKTIKLLILLMVATLGMQSCRKDSDIIDVSPPVPTTKGIKVQGSVMGTVVDENGTAVADATVTYSDLVTSTDAYGVFQFKDQTLFAEGTYIEVEKEGYFHGSRKFYPTENATSRVVVELLAMVEVGSFASSVGDKVEFEGTAMTFSDNSIMNADGSDYNGNVKVFAKYLDPTTLEMLDQMPGDLTAINANDERVVLTSYGMITVELRDDAGNELQVKTGSFVDVTSPVPSELLSSAPQTIPMWHFDEDAGTWVEEGLATLVNGVYETKLAHFSFWNYDVPSNFIHLSGSIFNRGIPVQGVLVKITNTDGGASGTGYTNENGVFGGYVPNGVELILEVYDQCGSLIYTTTVGPFNDDVVLEPFNLNILVDQVTISGSVTSCEGHPSDATYVVVNQADITTIVSLDDSYGFETSIFYCNSDASVTLGAVDPLNALASANSTFNIDGDVDAGTLELCEEALSNYLYYQYGDEEFLYTENSQDSSVFMGASYQIFNQPDGSDKYIYNVTVINWQTAGAMDYNLIYIEGMPSQEVTMPVPFGGFNASGIATIQKVSQGGEDFIIATGTLSDIEITDASLYDPSFNPLYFSSVTRLW